MHTLSGIAAGGWVAIGLSLVILLVFAGVRVADMLAATPSTGAFEVRYVHHPWVALVHIVPGLLFVTLAPLQLIPRIRQRHLTLHRRLGRFLLACAVVSGVFALVAAFRLPAFGGISTLAATLFFGPIFLFSLAKALWHARRRQIPQHREWMLRAFALALGVASIRVWVGLFTVAGLDFEMVFGTSFWLGLGGNLLAAEVWINLTRRHIHG